jgi:hypothetical protein
MCRTLVAQVAAQEDLPASAPPEIRGLFHDWLEEIEGEVHDYLKGQESALPEQVAARFGVSRESAVFLLKLAREGKTGP